MQDGSQFFLYLAVQYLSVNVFLLLDYFVKLAAPGFVFAVEVFDCGETVTFVEAEQGTLCANMDFFLYAHDVQWFSV